MWWLFWILVALTCIMFAVSAIKAGVRSDEEYGHHWDDDDDY